MEEIIDHQARELMEFAELKQRFEARFTDRAKAQLIMDGQQEQLKHWVAETERLNAKVEQLTQVRDQKAILNAAKQACRKNAQCFHRSGSAMSQNAFYLGTIEVNRV